MPDKFSRTEMLIGTEAMKKLSESRVAVFGVGGVGGYVVEALARSGVGAIDVIDNDAVAITNLNRQLIATVHTIGMRKTDAAEARIKSINPDCKVTKHNVFYLPETEKNFNFREYDYIVDAIDTVTGKLALAANAKAAGTPIISSMGTGNKMNPAAFKVADLFDTSVCPLCKVMRRECRRRGIDKLKVVYSEEEPLVPGESGEENERRRIPGSTAFAPGAAGLIIASEVVKDLTGYKR